MYQIDVEICIIEILIAYVDIGNIYEIHVTIF